MQNISVIIPCFNAARYINEAIDSVLKQTVLPIEIIVVDDGSTDESANIAKSIDKHVKVLQQHNQGESVARNRGIKEASGDWVAFLDADDIWKPGKLEAQLAIADEETVAVHTNNFQFGGWQGRTHYEKYDAATRYTLHCLLTRPIGPPSSLLVRRCLDVRFPEWTKFGEDRIYWLALAQKGLIRLVEEPLTGWRRHNKSQTVVGDMSLKTYTTIDTWLKANPGAVSPADEIDVRRQWIAKVVEGAAIARNTKAWDAYSTLYAFVKTLPRDWTIRKFLYKEALFRFYMPFLRHGPLA